MTNNSSLDKANDDNDHNINRASSDLINNWQRVSQQIEQAVSQADLDATKDMKATKDKVVLLAVSKTKPAEMIATLAAEGQRAFGENYLQEATDKISVLRDHADSKNIVWHYIGHIQRNKTRDIAEHFDWVQTIEREIIAKRLNAQRPDDRVPLNVLIQLNIDNEDSKSGCRIEDLPDLVASIKGYERLKLRGLMIIPAQDDTDAFSRTQQLFIDIKNKHPDLEDWDTLSMGMSGDMAQAIAHGSTMVRVGSAIFGARD